MDAEKIQDKMKSLQDDFDLKQEKIKTLEGEIEQIRGAYAVLQQALAGEYETQTQVVVKHGVPATPTEKNSEKSVIVEPTIVEKSNVVKEKGNK